MNRRCSCHPYSAFHWADPGYPGMIKWTDINRAHISSASSSAVVNAKRANGVDIAHIYGLSSKSQPVKLDPRRFHVYSKAKSNG